MTSVNRLNLRGLYTDREIPVDAVIEQLVIAGWTGRDQEAMEAHIRELEALGISRPKATPTFYRVAASLLTTADSIEVTGEDSSGEVEAVLFSVNGEQWIGVGSDHTDRNAERFQVTLSKQACAKPVGPELWSYREVEPHWDALMLRSFALIDGSRILYQEGPINTMRDPAGLVGLYTNGAESLASGTAMFCGTLAVRGAVRPAVRFEIEIEDPVLKRRLTHGYSIHTLPIAG